MNGNVSASRKLLAQIERGSGISRALLRTAWDNTFDGPSGENPADEDTLAEAGRVMANIDELSRPQPDFGALLRPGYDEPRGPGRPLTGEEPLSHTVRILLASTDVDRLDAARGRESRSGWIRNIILRRLAEQNS